MQTQPEENGSTSTRSRRDRRRRWLAGVLLLATVSAGATAQVWGRGAQDAPGEPLGATRQVDFQAKSAGPVRFQGHLDRTSVLAGSDGLVRMELIMRGDADAKQRATRVATDLVVVLDRSGSMRGQPIAHALASVRELIAQLANGDRFGLITYASDAQLAIPLETVTGDARAAWLRSVDRVAAGGGTNMSGGLDLAASTIGRLRTPGRVPRVILLSDGHANEGDASYAGLVARAAGAVKGEYVLSTVGVGEGFDEALMTALSDAGTGNFYYVRRGQELDEIFSREFASARETVASALEVAITPGPGVQVVSAAGYPLEVRGDVVRFRPGALFAGQERRVWVGLHVPTNVSTEGAVDAPPISLGEFSLSYRTPSDAPTTRRSLGFEEIPQVARVAGRDQFIASVDKDAWERSVVEEAYGALKQSVARSLRLSQPAAAMATMRDFKAKQGVLNADIGSGRVDEMLADVARMEEAVEATAESKDAAQSNRLRKQYQAEGYDGRRQGAKY